MTLIPLDVSKRMKQQKQIKDNQKYQMSLDMINATQDNYMKTESALSDKYMRDALLQVRQNPGGIDTNYANATGSGILHQRNPKPVKQKKQLSVSGSRQKLRPTNKPKQIKEVVIDESPLVPYDWNEMCKQIGKPRLNEQISYFGSLRRCLQTKRKGRFTYAN